MGPVSVWEDSGVLQTLLCHMPACTSVLALGCQGTFAGGTRPPPLWRSDLSLQPVC